MKNPAALPAPTASFRTMRQLALSLLAAACVAGGGSARAEIEFAGILVTPGVTRFSLHDTATGKTDWVTAGDVFAGYTVGVYDALRDTLLLKQNDQELRLRLKPDSKVKAARGHLVGAVTFGISDKPQTERVTLLMEQENVFPQKDGVTYRVTPTRRPDGNIGFQILIERPFTDVDGVKKMQGARLPALVAKPGEKVSINAGENLGFSFTPEIAPSPKK